MLATMNVRPMARMQTPKRPNLVHRENVLMETGSRVDLTESGSFHSRSEELEVAHTLRHCDAESGGIEY